MDKVRDLSLRETTRSPGATRVKLRAEASAYLYRKVVGVTLIRRYKVTDRTKKIC